MSLRAFVALVAAAAVAAGFIALFLVPTTADGVHVHHVRCAPMSGNPNNSQAAEERQAIGVDQILGTKSTGTPIWDACQEAASTRKIWAAPLLIAGIVALLGTAVVRPTRPGPPAV